MTNDSSSKRLTTAVEVASNLVSFQLISVEMNLASLWSFGDYFALGYVFGFHDAMCQVFELERNASEGWTMLALSYTELAGAEGPTFARRSMDLSSGNKEFSKGMQLGGSECVAFARNKTEPFGLYRHLKRQYGG